MERFHLDAAEAPTSPRYNIAPTQDVAVILSESPSHLSIAKWGLIPSWAKAPSIGAQMINAHGETLPEKPSFRSAFKKQRCLVLADGFYEWRKEADGKTKTPMLMRLKDGDAFAFAGLYELWKTPEGQYLRSCTIVTCEPNELMQPIHNRMPVILAREAESEWLDVDTPALALMAMLKPYPTEGMAAFAVSRRVNSPANDDASVMQPA